MMAYIDTEFEYTRACQGGKPIYYLKLFCIIHKNCCYSAGLFKNIGLKRLLSADLFSCEFSKMANETW